MKTQINKFILLSILIIMKIYPDISMAQASADFFTAFEGIGAAKDAAQSLSIEDAKLVQIFTFKSNSNIFSTNIGKSSLNLTIGKSNGWLYGFYSANNDSYFTVQITKSGVANDTTFDYKLVDVESIEPSYLFYPYSKTELPGDLIDSDSLPNVYIKNEGKMLSQTLFIDPDYIVLSPRKSYYDNLPNDYEFIWEVSLKFTHYEKGESISSYFINAKNGDMRTEQTTNSSDEFSMKNSIFRQSEPSIFPNPATDEAVLITSPEIKSLRIDIYNSLGNLELTIDGKNHQKLDLRSLAAGAYFVKIDNGSGINIFPLAIVR
ncbi:MAG: Secretion system C-terminal sorting domain [Bacteroidota bacterium]|nr:Secretion system C-terminal sorting domain [Bacteroidota bacterium]